MEELQQKLFELQNLTVQMSYLSGLIYILREALRINEDALNVQYTMASAYISNAAMNFEEELFELTEGMFSAVRHLAMETGADIY